MLKAAIIIIITAAAAFLGILAVYGTTSCPRSITAQVPEGYDQGKKSSMKALHKRLLKCANNNNNNNVRSLDLTVRLQGCSNWPDRWNFPFRLAGGERYPALTSLVLEGYRFNQSEWEDAKPPGRYDEILEWLNFGGLQKYVPLWLDTPVERRHLTNLELWLEAMDWSRLESLAIRKGVEDYFVDLAGPRLTGLKNLTIESGWRNNEAAIPRFLKALPDSVQLETLAWLDVTGYDGLTEVLERHCGSLKRLRLFSWVPTGSNALTKEQLDMLVEKCPSLEQISLVFDRNGAWPWERFATLSRMPSLASVEIWLELPNDGMRGVTNYMRRQPDQRHYGEQPYREPRLSARSANQIFRFFQEQRRSQDLAPLQNLSFYIGDWSRPWDGPIYDPIWFEGVKSKYECTVIKGDGAPKGSDDQPCVLVDGGSSSGNSDYDLSDDIGDATISGYNEDMNSWSFVKQTFPSSTHTRDSRKPDSPISEVK